VYVRIYVSVCPYLRMYVCVYVRMCGLSNDAISNSDNTASNNKMDRMWKKRITGSFEALDLYQRKG
jgi:hypothetical protein